jgi:hypothetical protein
VRVCSLARRSASRSEFCRSLEICFTQGSEACQASAIAALHSLCDSTLSLHPVPATATAAAWAAYLADSLPTRETLAEIMTVLLNPFTCEVRTHFSIQLLTIRTFVMLVSSGPRGGGGDHTFAVLAECLAAKHRMLFSFLRKLAVDFEARSADCRACVAESIAFLAQLMELPPPPPEALFKNDGDDERTTVSPPRRTLCLKAAELAWVVQWTSSADTVEQAADRRRTHPLTLLQVRLTESLLSHQQEGEEDGGLRQELLQIKVRTAFVFPLFFV